MANVFTTERKVSAPRYFVMWELGASRLAWFSYAQYNCGSGGNSWTCTSSHKLDKDETPLQYGLTRDNSS